MPQEESKPKPSKKRRPPLQPWVPDWIKNVGCPAWVVDPEQRISYMNDRARSIFECSDSDWPGTPCHEITHGERPSGGQLCHKGCGILGAARRGREVPSFLLRRRAEGESGGSAWLLVSVLPLHEPGKRALHLVHLAHDVSRMHRAESFLRAATDPKQLLAYAERPPIERLSQREFEILDLMSRNEDVKRIAAKLFISHSTARNHVQHVLAKLDVHSTQEAIALHLLFDPVPDLPEEE